MTIKTFRYPTPPGYGDVVASYSDVEAAGAIHSLRWPVGQTVGLPTTEFINSNDDGRFLQSAVSFDDLGEADNPTEGGSSMTPGFWTPSDSRLIQATAPANVLVASNRMAYWQTNGGRTLSDVGMSKRVTLGYAGTWNAIEHVVAFSLPQTQRRRAQFEFLTGYMPSQFSRFYTLDRATGTLAPLSDGPGEQSLPVIMATADGQWAMGCWVPAWGNAAPASAQGGYGRWRFTAENVVKWNCVSRVGNPTPGGVYEFRTLMAFGSLDDVRRTLSGLPG